MIPAATSHKSSGMPSISSPESVVFQAVDRLVAVTRGMDKGLKKPKINKETPMRKRQPGGGCSAVFISCFTFQFSVGLIFQLYPAWSTKEACGWRVVAYSKNVTLPVLTSYIAPTNPISPLSIISRSTTLLSRSFCMVSCTFIFVTAWTNFSFFEVLGV
jgi:hypothetical protein